MRKTKQTALKVRGWRVGSVEDFLELTQQETALVELKLRLSDALKARREKLKLSQSAVAKQLHSSQSRVAKMEAGDASVSFDLLMRALMTLGATTNDLAKTIHSKKKRVAA